LFEGTIVSVGRGTQSPFQIIGFPGNYSGSYLFTPQSIPGISEHPQYEGQACYGSNLTGFADNFLQNDQPFNLFWLITMYESVKDSVAFFKPYFDKLAGNEILRNDIIKGISESEIRKSWKNDLNAFKKIRNKYLLYPD